MKLKFLFYLLSLVWLIPFHLDAGEPVRFQLSGYLKDAASGEVLLFGNVSIVELNTGTTTNQYGFYSLAIPAGTYTIRYSYLGYETVSKSLNVKSNAHEDIELIPKSTRLNAVEITGKSRVNAVSSTEIGAIRLDIKQLKSVPVLFGEKDILKGIQLLPGVSPSNEGSSNYFVRGGEADQNHILLDEAPVYNASHLLGFFSVFNSDAVKDVKLYKGGIPAPYGGRVSSVLDIRMRDGNARQWGFTGGLGLISSRLTVEGPLVKDKSSIMISGRRTYLDMVAKLFSKTSDSLTFYFYDLNLKANYILGRKDRLFISGYLGRDIFDLGPAGFNSGNKTLTLRWNHTFNQVLFLNTSAIYSDYDYGFKASSGIIGFKLAAGIIGYTLKQDYTWFLNADNQFRFGWNSTLHRFKPGNFEPTDNTNPFLTGFQIDPKQVLESGIYASNDQKAGHLLTLNYGCRVSLFNNIKSANDTLSGNDQPNGPEKRNLEIFNTFIGFEPRVTANFLIGSNSSIKANYNRMYQYLHILSNALSTMPTDLWTPCTPVIKPTIADQVSLGWFKNLPKKSWDLSIEAYYKKLGNLVDYKNGANTFLNPNIEPQLEFGQGRAYGVEFSAGKSTGKLTGWISYTIAKSEKQFDHINHGDWFSARQDRTHNISIVASYRLSDRVTLSGNWIYFTGDAVTFPSGKYKIDGVFVNLYTERNGSRMPDYHRLDLGLTYQLKPRKRWNSELSFSAYNVYNRKNAYTISFRESETVPGTTEAVRLSLFGLVPSISWNFKF